MRIVVDYRPALRARTGVGEFIHQVACRLARDPADQVTLFSSSWKDRLTAQPPGALAPARTVDRRIPVRLLNLAWHRLRWPSIETLAGGAFDVAHSPHPLLLPSRTAARVVTIADLHFLSHPERASAEIRRDYPALARTHAHLADRVIVISNFVAGEVARRLGVPAARISVCTMGGPEWRLPPAGPNDDGYILFLGTLEPRKNVGGLLEAYGRLVARCPAAPRLVIAGGAPAGAGTVLEAMAAPPLAGRVEYRGYVAAERREALYKGAQIFVLPSYDEGFGIPALEAMAAGVPVIVSDRGALPEVVGDAGVFINPDDPDSLAAAMQRLAADPALRAACARKGLERARQFTWDGTARSVRRAYEAAIESRDAHRH